MPKHDSPFGPTGEFPRGKIRPDDEGAIQIGITHEADGTVMIDFGSATSWIGFPPEQAIQFAKAILKHAGAKKIEITL